MPKQRLDPAQNSKFRFMTECVADLLETGEAEDEADATEQCELRWQEANPTPQRSASAIIRKTHTGGNTGGLHYVLSDESIDRAGDQILAAGWDLLAFKRHSPALFGHDSSFVIGRWRDVKVVGAELRGRLELAPRGTSDRVDEVRRLIEASLLPAVSVGFRSLQSRPREGGLGTIFEKSELLEASIVAVPCNTNALQIAKSLRISEATQKLVFRGHASITSAQAARRAAQARFDSAIAAVRRECDKLREMQRVQRQNSAGRPVGFALGDPRELAELARLDLRDARILDLNIKAQRTRVDIAEGKLAVAFDELAKLDKGARR
jgi:HK97 family phage prohead protease